MGIFSKMGHWHVRRLARDCTKLIIDASMHEYNQKNNPYLTDSALDLLIAQGQYTAMEGKYFKDLHFKYIGFVCCYVSRNLGRNIDHQSGEMDTLHEEIEKCWPIVKTTTDGVQQRLKTEDSSKSAGSNCPTSSSAGHEEEELQVTMQKIKKHRFIHRSKEPNEAILELCQKLILKEWMYLDDLPKELANTVANIYYAHCELTVLMMACKNGYISQSKMLKELGIGNIEDDFIMSVTNVLPAYESKVMVDFQTINDMINNIRQIDAEYGNDSDEYQAAVDFAVTAMKYDIDVTAIETQNAEVVKRQFEENIIDEIPDLIDYLDV